AVEIERRRGLDAEANRFGDVARDRLARCVTVETGEKRGAVDADVRRVFEQAVAVEMRLMLEQLIVILPEAPLCAGAFRCLRRQARVFVPGLLARRGAS